MIKTVKSILIICDQSPIGKNSAAEAIRIGSGFVALGEAIDCKIAFTGDAIYLLNKYGKPSEIGIDQPIETIEMAELSDLELFIIESDLIEAGLTRNDLIDYNNLKIITLEELTELISNVDTVFRF